MVRRVGPHPAYCAERYHPLESTNSNRLALELHRQRICPGADGIPVTVIARRHQSLEEAQSWLRRVVLPGEHLQGNRLQPGIPLQLLLKLAKRLQPGCIAPAQG